MAANQHQQTATLSPQMVLHSGGWFIRGSEQGRPDERPRHRVYVAPFALGVQPVTNREYAVFIAAGGPEPRFWHDDAFNHPDQPVVAVTWSMAMAYCDWLCRETGGRYRLPREAEWEFAALGGVEGRLYPWGDGMPESASGVPLAARPMDRPAKAGTGPPSRAGLSDLGWNIHEWCLDWYDPDYYAVSAARNPRGPDDGSRRVSRGGAWRHQVKVSRCAARSDIPPDIAYNDYGFRLAAGTEMSAE